MIIKYWGHSFFTMTMENGTVIATDPYGVFYQYPKRKVKADICCVSHHHHDHDGVECVSEEAVIVEGKGTHKPLPGVVIHGVETFHDEKQGALRGKNTVFVIEAEGLRIVHAGDLGHTLTKQQAAAIGRTDVLLLPVGGYYTIDAFAAEQVRQTLKAAVTVPMHYRTKYDEDMPITDVQTFLNLTGAQDSQMPLFRVTAGDLLQRPEIVTLSIMPE